MHKLSIFSAVLLTAAVVASPPAAQAQGADTKQALAKVRAIGKHWNRDVLRQTAAIYTPLLEKASKDGVVVTKDIAYGADAKQKLDIYAPNGGAAGSRPIVVFVHGGGLTGGDKGGLIYGNVPTFFARHGIVGVNANYRLVPNVTWPEGGKDMAGIVTWLKGNVALHGGDPQRIFLMGHSAGGTHVAHYLNDAKVQAGGNPGIAGAILLSGAFHTAKSGPRVKVSKAYYGDDPAKWDERTPFGMAKAYKGNKVPVFVITAELDPESIEHSGVDMFQLLCKRDGCPRFKQVRGHNHLSVAVHLNTDDESLGPELLDFVGGTARMAAAK